MRRFLLAPRFSLINRMTLFSSSFLLQRSTICTLRFAPDPWRAEHRAYDKLIDARIKVENIEEDLCAVRSALEKMLLLFDKNPSKQSIEIATLLRHQVLAQIACHREYKEKMKKKMELDMRIQAAEAQDNQPKIRNLELMFVHEHLDCTRRRSNELEQDLRRAHSVLEKMWLLFDKNPSKQMKMSSQLKNEVLKQLVGPDEYEAEKRQFGELSAATPPRNF